MARARRQWIDGGLYHLYSRGSNRQAIVVNEADFVDLESILFSAFGRHHIDVYAWCLMPNHWHCLVRSPEAGLSRLMQTVNQRHSLRLNRRWGRTAHLFENRFGAVLQESQDQLLWTLRYIIRNPVEAGLAASPADARWTSYRPTVGWCPAPDCLRVEAVEAMFRSPLRDGRAGFAEFVAAPTDHALAGAAALVDRLATIA